MGLEAWKRQVQAKFGLVAGAGKSARVALTKFASIAARYLISAWILSLSPLTQAANIQYVYDEAGRLVEVVAPDNTNVRYTYDAAGNLLASKKGAAGSISIAEFTPNGGPAGTNVTIYGSGFNTTAASNTVKFNGTAATVLSASATVLTAQVPASATTGPISVTNGTATATSATSFAVGASLMPGTPPVASNLKAGQKLSFNFSGTAGQGYTLGLTGITGATISVSVLQPNGSTWVTCTVTGDTGCVLPYLPVSGNYTVQLTGGSGASSANIALNADIGGALSAGTPVTFAATKIGQAGTYTVAGTAGQFLQLNLTNDNIPGYSKIELYSPSGTLLQSTFVSASASADGAATINVASLPATGTYRVRLIPPSGRVTGAMVLTQAPIVNGSVSIDGTVVSGTLATGQRAVYGFAGTAGQGLGVELSSIVTTPLGSNVAVTIYKPDGNELTKTTVKGAIGGTALPSLPVGGTYKILIDPQGNAAKFGLAVLPDVVGTVKTDATVTSFAPTHVGQAGSFTFSGTAGANLVFSLGGDTFPGDMGYIVYRPDGTQLVTGSLNSFGTPSATAQTLSALPATGTYKIRIMPPANALGTASLALNGVTAGSVVPDGAALPVSLMAAQVGRYTFVGGVGQRLAVGLSGIATTPAAGYLSVTVRGPDGYSFYSFTSSGAAGGDSLPVLTAGGTYTIEVNPGNYAAKFNLWLSSDVVGKLTGNGPATTFSSARPGQAATYTFDGVAGQAINVSLTNYTFAGTTYYSVYQPDGTRLKSSSASNYGSTATADTLTLFNLPTSGTYTVRVMPDAGVLGSVSVALNTPMTLNAEDPALVANIAGGRPVLYAFSGTAGQRLGLGLSGLTTAARWLDATVYRQNGSLLDDFFVNGASGGGALTLLPETGTYTVLVAPPYQSNDDAKFSLWLSNDARGTLTANGAALLFNATRPGQAASFTFSGTAGQAANLLLSGNTFAKETAFSVYKPDGSQLDYSWVFPTSSGSPASANLLLNNLPSTGTYTVRIVPADGSTGKTNASLSIVQPLAIDASAKSVSLAAGTAGLYSFAGTAGQSLGLGIAGMLTTPAGGKVEVTVWRPDGTQLKVFTVAGGDSGQALPVLPATGTYTVRVDPAGAAATFNLLLSKDATGALVANGSALTFAPTRVGQAMTYSFSGTAGTSITLAFSDDTFVGTTELYVYDPSGGLMPWTGVNYTSGGTPGTQNLSETNLPSTGTYTLRIVPAGPLGKITTKLTAP